MSFKESGLVGGHTWRELKARPSSARSADASRAAANLKNGVAVSRSASPSRRVEIFFAAYARLRSECE